VRTTISQADTLVFQGRRNTEVHLIPDIGHCGVLGGPSKMPEVIDMVVTWLPAQIGLANRQHDETPDHYGVRFGRYANAHIRFLVT
jgi:hypothetical protein